MFKPQVGPFGLTDYEKVYATDPAADIFELRGLDRGGVVVVVRPDQYVANVLPLTATAELGAFFAPLLQAGKRAPNSRTTRAKALEPGGGRRTRARRAAGCAPSVLSSAIFAAANVP